MRCCHYRAPHACYAEAVQQEGVMPHAAVAPFADTFYASAIDDLMFRAISRACAMLARLSHAYGAVPRQLIF